MPTSRCASSSKRRTLKAGRNSDPETHVWLTVFETNHRDWVEKPLAARNLDFGLDGSGIERIGTGGGTNMLEALTHVAGKVKKHSVGRSAAILILTDGQIGNEEAVVLCAQEAGCPVHVVGIAITPNDAATRRLSLLRRNSTFSANPPHSSFGMRRKKSSSRRRKR